MGPYSARNTIATIQPDTWSQSTIGYFYSMLNLSNLKKLQALIDDWQTSADKDVSHSPVQKLIARIKFFAPTDADAATLLTVHDWRTGEYPRFDTGSLLEQVTVQLEYDSIRMALLFYAKEHGVKPKSEEGIE